MIPTFEKLTRSFLLVNNVPQWFQTEPVTLSMEKLELFKTIDEIQIYKLKHRNTEVNIFFFCFYNEGIGMYSYYISMEAEDTASGETIYPIYHIGDKDEDLSVVGNLTFNFQIPKQSNQLELS